MGPLSRVKQSYVPEGFIDLGLGNPQDELLALELIRKAANKVLARSNRDFLQYGAENGNGLFLKSLAEFLSKSYGYPVPTDELFITNGASMGLHLVCSLFTKPGDTIFVEEPTYHLALRIFADHHLNPISISIDEHGLLIGDLEVKLSSFKPAFLYTIPVFQNPSGCTLAAERRQSLVELSRMHGFSIVADEVYQLLDYFDKPPLPLASNIHDASIISLGSFSKILAPGLRVGWLQAGPQIINQFIRSGLLESSGGLNPFTSVIINHLIENGDLEENIKLLKSIYLQRIVMMEKALKRNCPQISFFHPRGGFFLWAQLPNRMDAACLLEKAQAYKIRFRPGSLFSSQGGLKDCMRLSFAYYDGEELQEGIRRLSLCLAD